MVPEDAARRWGSMRDRLVAPCADGGSLYDVRFREHAMMDRDQLRQNIRTIIVVMMENRSFDHVLGHMRLPGYGFCLDVEGITQVGSVTYMNPAGDGTLILFFLVVVGLFFCVLFFVFGCVCLLFVLVFGQYAMNGFVQAYEQFNLCFFVLF